MRTSWACLKKDKKGQKILKGQRTKKFLKDIAIYIFFFSFFCFVLCSVTEKIEEMTSSVYLTLSWRDLRLSWKPEEFNGISQIRIPSDAIWKPDFALHNK